MPKLVRAFLCSCAWLLLSPAAMADDAREIFKDREDVLVRAGSADGLERGESLMVVGPADKQGKRSTLGSAVVLEVFPAMARVHLDAGAQNAKSARFVLVRAPGKAPEAKAAEAAAPETKVPEAKAGKKAEEKAEEKPAAPEQKVAAGNRQLKGRASVIGIGPLRRISLQNLDTFAWTKCDLRLPDNRRYRMEAPLAAGDSDGIVLPRFVQDGVERDVPIESIQVSCAEGSAKLTFGF